MAPSSQSVVHLGSERYHEKLNTMRTAVGERDCVYPILWNLEPLLYMPHKVFERGDLDDKMWGLISEFRDREAITSLSALGARIREILNELDASGGNEWHGHHKATILKALNRFSGLTTKFNGLLTDGNVDYGNLPRTSDGYSAQEVRVIDIAHCNSNVQELLVTSIIDRIWKMAERGDLGVDKLVVFVDELNKYAPNGGEGGLRDTLVDIAARGRHLNVVLFGAQQFRSKVDTEILGNCGTSFYGRVGDEEIINSSYRSLSETTKAELLGLPKGRLLVRHAHFRAPLFGAFPRPPVIAGMAGQRVFNSENGISSGASPADAIHRLLLKYPSKDMPTLGQVRTVAGDLSAETIERICTQAEQGYRSRDGTSAAKRFTLWKMIQRDVMKATGIGATRSMSLLRIAHFSDTHLGYRALTKSDPASGRNQRAVDIETAFAWVVDDILHRDVQLVIHSGDVFHQSRPVFPAIGAAIRQLRKLEREGIPVVVIAGNHDTPRLRTTGSVYGLMESALPDVRFFGGYDDAQFPLEGTDVVLTVIPHGRLTNPEPPSVYPST